MIPLVEAGSLATVIDLANDPPEHFQLTSRPQILQPLVLYIARVPGSRDVFLTTMKPQQKVVTAQDVQSSLYYVHADSDNDYKLLEDDVLDPISEDVQDAKSNIPPIPKLSISGKPTSQPPPLPPRTPSITSLAPSPRADSVRSSHISGQNGRSVITRKPVGQSNWSHRKAFQEPPTPHGRNLLGPRPMGQNQKSADASALQAVPERKNLALGSTSEQPTVVPPKLPPRANSMPLNEHYDFFPNDAFQTLEARVQAIHGPKYQHCWEWEKSWPEKHRTSLEAAQNQSSQVFSEAEPEDQRCSLTLIRRHGEEQWNVGKIMGRGSPTTRKGSIEEDCTFDIDIETDGYSKFLESKKEDQDSRYKEDSEKQQSLQDSSIPNQVRPVFSRCLKLSGQDKTSQGTRERQSFRSPSSDSEETTGLASPGLAKRTPESVSYQSTSNSLPAKTCQMESPWHGICQFTSGIAGRSLKCKHSSPSTDPSYGPGMRSATVSELRFNLPSSDVLGTPKGAKHSSLFHGRSKRDSLLLDAGATVVGDHLGIREGLEDRLDLTLGQEHAGGGFGGKQAKLGKLIVENEGLQMLDLIVAANVALWWRVYEKIT